VSLLDSDRVRELLDRAGLGELPATGQRAVLLLAVVVVAAAAWRFWPSAPVPEIAFDAGDAPGVLETAETSGADADPACDIVVHVAGAVLYPGLYSIPAGSRIGDAISAAGGGLETAALDALNLARILADGEQVYVLTVEQVESGTGPGGAAPASSGSSSASRDVININRATAAELESLPGVGPATAQKIVDDRESNGPFAAPEDLMRVPGIGAKKFESMREFVTCG